MAGTPAYQRLFAELKRRHVFKVAAVYGGVAFVVLQVADIMVPALALPEALTRAIALVLILGFPIALVLAWAFEVTPEGMRRTEEPTAGEIDAIVSQPRSRRWPSGILALAGISLLVVGAFFVLRPEVTFRGPRTVEADEAVPGIAVLPFSVSGPESEFWREGMANTLATNLNGLGGLRTVASRTVLARWDAAVGETEVPDLATALQVARSAGATYAVIGDLVTAGDRTRASADVYDVETGRLLGQATSVGSVAGDSAFAFVDRFTVEIVRVTPTPAEEITATVDLASLTTTSVDALKAYLEGEAHFRRSNFVDAIEAYRRAVEIDSTFAMAHYRLSKSYGWERGFGTFGDHYLAADRMSDRLAERERTQVKAYVAFLDGRILDVIDMLEEAVRRHPDDVEAWFTLGDALYHMGDQALRDRLVDSDRAFERALALDPTLGPTHIHLIANAFEMGDSALARQRLEAYRLYAAGSPTMRANDLAYAIAFGDDTSREEAMAVLDTVSFQDVNAVATIPASLLHPRMLDAKVEATERLLAGGAADENQQFLFLIGLTGAARERGRWGDFEALYDDPRLDGAQVFEVYRAWLEGLAVPEEIMQRDFVLTPADTLFDGKQLVGMFVAADRGEATEVTRQASMLLELADADEAEGNEAWAETGRWLAEMATARVEWQGGNPEALARLAALQREATGWQFLVPLNEIQRLWLADMYLAEGRDAEAERYYRSLDRVPRAVLALARLRDAAGDLDEAAQFYARFVEFWKDADPELQPLVEEARGRLQEIVSARG
jgi:tetratricopeptide (TPR) repeat protein